MHPLHPSKLTRNILFTLLIVAGCADNSIVERLKTLTGNEFLEMSEQERSAIVADALDRFTTWRIWERPDICSSLLNQESLAGLFQQSAEAAQDNLLMFSLTVISNDECINRGEVSK